MDMFSNNTDFYPTPTEVINTMMPGEDFIGKTILEPSAGSGNIVKWLRENSAGEKWKTNANYMVNRKFIVPNIVSYDSRYSSLYGHMRLRYGDNEYKIEDVVKALCYITGTNYDNIENLHSFVYNGNLSYGTWYEWGFFRIKGFKKGTMHFEFVDEKVWMKFNREVAKQRGWVLPKKKG